MSAPYRPGSSHPVRYDGGQSQHQGGARSFARAGTMLTAKSQAARIRLATIAAEKAKYLGDPPNDTNLCRARIVLPGGHRLPRGLDDETSLDGVRRKHQAWIVRVDSNVLEISSVHIANLQAAVQATNWAIHDMRLTNDHPVVRFFLQRECKAVPGAMIKFERGSRPYVATKDLQWWSAKNALEGHIDQLGSALPTAAERLMALGKDLNMRVNFGLLHFRQKRKGIGNDFAYDRFADVLNEYSLRGGANLETRLPDLDTADSVLLGLTDPENGIYLALTEVRYGCSLTLATNENEIRADVHAMAHHTPQLGTPRMTAPESSARLNWTMATPDMAYDWNLRADAWDVVDNVPTDLLTLMKGISLKFANLDGSAKQIVQIRLQTSAVIPFRDTPWSIEINATQTWKGPDTKTAPEVYWGVQVYGAHWDEALNYRSDSRRKDWGEELKYIWLGKKSWEERFGAFVESVLEIQAALNENLEAKAARTQAALPEDDLYGRD